MIKQKEIRKLEVEKLKSKEDILAHWDEQRRYWLKRYEEEHKNHLTTLTQLNKLKVEIQDLKATIAKLRSDIRELDKSHKISIQLARDKEKEHEELLKINEKLRVQVEGAKDALSNLEIHHKDYIIKLKKEHRKTLSSIGNIYNMNGMEYEDLYTKMGYLTEKYQDNWDIIKSLRANLKSYKDKVRRATDDLAEFVAKYDIIKKNMESLRLENHKLEDDNSKKNDEIKELNLKCKVLSEDKDMLRKDLVNMTRKVEVVIETDEKLLSQTSIDDSDDESEELFDCFGNNEKMIQTITCIRKSKAVQTEVSNVDLQK